LFAEEGANVIVADLDQAGIDAVVASIKAKGGKATGIDVNVSKEEDVAKMIGSATSTYGSLDVLVNNAGIMDDFMPIDYVTNEGWERVMAVNVSGPMYACRLSVPIMLKQGKGSIINIASVGGLEGSRAGAAYTASKHALIGLTKNIGFMYAQKGIKCQGFEGLLESKAQRWAPIVWDRRFVIQKKDVTSLPRADRQAIRATACA
jgi:NAD(P)-dependent dehydrogenase (short-subunit alcohol dehydrogenase family)